MVLSNTQRPEETDMQDDPWIDRKGWAKVAGIGKDHVTIVYDPELGALAGNWRDGELVGVGADRSPMYPANIAACAPLALWAAYSHLTDDVRMPAIEWLLEHDHVVPDAMLSELEDWYAQGGDRSE